MTETAGRAAGTPLELDLLRLLAGDPYMDPDNVDWSELLSTAQQHGALRRLEAWFARRDEQPSGPIAAAFADAGADSARRMAHIGRISRHCSALGIQHLFLNLSQQAPDLGHDVDLLVWRPPGDPDCAALAAASGAPERRDLGSRVAGITRLHVADDVTVEMHHQTLGRVGEQARYARRLLRRRQRVLLDGVACYVPSPEDALLLLVMRRLYGRPELRVGDICWTLATIRAETLDWSYLEDAAATAGLREGLRCYLDCADQIHRQVMGRPLPGVQADFPHGHWGPVRFQRGRYRIPGLVPARLYLSELWSDLSAGEFAAALRLCFLPFAAATAGVRQLVHAGAGSA